MPGYERIWYADCGVTAVRGCYLIAVGSKRLALEQVLHQAEAAEWLKARHGRFAYVGIREAGTDVRAPADARDAMTEVGRTYASCVLGGALVFEGGGFAATIHRSFATAIQIASRARFPLRVFDDLAAGAHWLEGKLPPERAMGEGALLHAMRLVRRRAEERLASGQAAGSGLVRRGSLR